MSFEIFHNGRPQGQVASIAGMEILEKELAARNPDPDTELARFLLRGWTDDPQALKQEIESVMADMTDDSQDILKAILKLLPEKGTVSVSAE